MTRDAVSIVDGLQRRFHVPADVLGVGAAGMEPASPWWVAQIGDGPWDADELFAEVRARA